MKYKNIFLRISLIIISLFFLSSCLLVEPKINIKTKPNEIEICKKNPSEKNCLIFEETFDYPNGSSLEQVNPDKWKKLTLE